MKGLKTLKYTLLTLTVITATFFVLLCGTVIVERFIMKKPVATFFGYSTVTIADGSGSMVPTLYPGDTVLLKKQKSYAVGDVITFNDSIGLVTHRIVEITDSGYKTKGDNEIQSLDLGERGESDVVGKMVSDGALGGFSKFMLSQWGVLIIGLIFGAGYLAVNTVYENKNNKINETEK